MLILLFKKIYFAKNIYIIFFIKQKEQNKKIMILLSYSVLLPERFFLRNQEIVLLVNSVWDFLKIRNCPFGAFWYKALQSSVRQQSLCLKVWILLVSCLFGSFSFMMKRKSLSCYLHTDYNIKFIQNYRNIKNLFK